MNLRDIRIAVCFKDFSGWTGRSGIGLCVAALTNARMLAAQGIHVAVFPVTNNIDLFNSIVEYRKEHGVPLTHVVISAFWLSRHDLKSLAEYFPNIKFVVECHSNVGFLQADPGGVELLRAVVDLSKKKYHQIYIGGNSPKFVDWVRTCYDADAILLPNLYPITQPHKWRWNGRTPIKIGVFGAVRPQKNFMTAAGAALAIHKLMRLPVELHMSNGGEGDGGSVSRAILQMCKDIPQFKLIKHDWRPWQDFIEVVHKMDLLIQPSYTESFNMVTADGIVAGVPSVVSEAIRWAPSAWKADSDDVMDVAQVGITLLNSGHSVKAGIKALEKSNKYALKHWLNFLSPSRHWWDFCT